MGRLGGMGSINIQKGSTPPLHLASDSLQVLCHTCQLILTAYEGEAMPEKEVLA